mgnify:CR=1 FL=1
MARTFADKVSKGLEDQTTHCDKCGETVLPAQLITSEQTGRGGAWSFKKRMVGICKCTEKEITG